MKCPYQDRCWRNSYSRYDKEIGWRGNVPPDRLTLHISGHASPDMTRKAHDHDGGIWCEQIPHNGQGYCPIMNGQRPESCYEYKKEFKRKHVADERALSKAKFFGNVAGRVHIPLATRKRIMEKYHYRCVFCGVHLGGTGSNRIKSHCDHFIPLAQGGLDNEDNLVLSCQHCNDSKGKEIWEIGCRIKKQPPI